MLPGVPLTAELEDYIESLLPERDAVLSRLEAEARSEGIPAVGPQVGMLLYTLAKLNGATRFLELGTAIGYSGIWLLRASPESRLVTLELNPERAMRARANFEEARLAERVEVVEGDAFAYLEAHPEPVDFVFHDLLNSLQSEAAAQRSFELCLERVRPGGLLTADNALRRGEVTAPSSQGARNVVCYNDLVARSPRLEGMVIPMRDGVSVARVRDIAEETQVSPAGPPS